MEASSSLSGSGVPPPREVLYGPYPFQDNLLAYEGAAMLCGREGNRRSILASHWTCIIRLSGLAIHGLSGLRKGNISRP